MDVNALVLLIGAIGALLTTINGVRSAIKKDKRKDNKDRLELEDWIIDKVKQNSVDAMKNMEDKYQALKKDFDDLASEKEQMEQQYLQQIALKEEENRALRKTNQVLRKENKAYREKYGVL